MHQTFQSFCQQFTSNELPHIVKIGKRYFHDPHNLMQLAQEQKFDVFGVGLYLGEQKNDFRPTSALIELLSRYNDKRVVVGSKAAWLFLCNRDILMDGVLEAGTFSHNEIVFVADHNQNILGIGKIVAPFNASFRNKTYVKNILDKGEYLRREKGN